MRQLTLPLKLYLSSVVLVFGVAIVTALLVQQPVPTNHTLVLGLLIGALTGLTYLGPVKLASKRTFVPYIALQVVAVLTLSPGEAALWCALGVAAGNLYLKRPYFNVLFNVAQIGLTVMAAAIA